jgi:hypothetical protein
MTKVASNLALEGFVIVHLVQASKCLKKQDRGTDELVVRNDEVAGFNSVPLLG